MRKVAYAARNVITGQRLFIARRASLWSGSTAMGCVTASSSGARRIRAWYQETVEQHGLAGRLSSIRCLDEALPNIGTVQSDKGEQLLALCEAAVREDGADVLIIAGAPLAGLARSIAHRIPVPVVDGVSSAVRHAETLAALAPRAATAGSFAPPPIKDWQGLSPALGKLIGRK